MAVLAAFAVPGAVLAETNQFFEPNVTRNIFSDEVVLRPTENFQNFRLRPAVAEQVPQVQNQEEPLAEESLAAEPQEELTPAQKLIKEYGSPGDVHPVLAKDDAPKPFRAMMAAMNKGEDKLAYEYAKQYVRYMQDLNKSNMRAVSLSQLAMVREGLMSEEQVISSTTSDDKKLLEEDIKAHLASEESESYLHRLDPATRAMLLKAEGAVEEEQQLEEEGAEEEVDEALLEEERIERYKAKQKLQHKHIPKDPEGKVDIMFFFKPRDIVSAKMSKTIEALFEISKEDENLNLIGFSLSPINEELELKFRRITKTTFPIKQATKAAKVLGIKHTPTTVVIAPTTGESVIEVGSKSFFYLDELIKKMQGGDQGE